MGVFGAIASDVFQCHRRWRCEFSGGSCNMHPPRVPGVDKEDGVVSEPRVFTSTCSTGFILHYKCLFEPVQKPLILDIGIIVLFLLFPCHSKECLWQQTMFYNCFRQNEKQLFFLAIITHSFAFYWQFSTSRCGTMSLPFTTPYHSNHPATS